MLYDPKWEKPAETKGDPFSLASLIAWLEKQPGDKTYCYSDNGFCLVAQYLLSLGNYSKVGVDGVGFYDRSDSELYVPKRPLPAFFNNVAINWPHTFGAALERARALQTKG